MLLPLQKPNACQKRHTNNSYFSRRGFRKAKKEEMVIKRKKKKKKKKKEEEFLRFLRFLLRLLQSVRLEGKMSLLGTIWRMRVATSSKCNPSDLPFEDGFFFFITAK